MTNPGAVIGRIKDFAGGISTEIFNNSPLNAGAAFTRISLDLSSITGLNNQSFVALRFDDFDNGTGNNDMRIDNFLVTAIPEPSTALLGGLGMLALLRRRLIFSVAASFMTPTPFSSEAGVVFFRPLPWACASS